MRPLFLICTLLFSFNVKVYSQKGNSIAVTPNSNKLSNRFFRSGIYKATVVPTVLIGYGIFTIHGRGFPSSDYIYKEVHEHLNIKRSHVDDYLQYLPYAGLIGLNLLKIKSNNDFINTGILTIKSVALNTILVFTIKGAVNIIRPDSANPAEHNSFPSGHTANAFAAATLVHKEFGKTSLWYSAGAYSVATTVGVFRILNNRHWFSDVLAGAGFGILSVNLVYLTHRYRWGNRPEMLFVPTFSNKIAGFYYRMKF